MWGRAAPPLAQFSAPSRRSLRRVRRRAREGQDRVALLLALRPYERGLVVDVLEDDREGAIVLAGHGRALTFELHAEAQHGAALREVDTMLGFGVKFEGE